MSTSSKTFGQLHRRVLDLSQKIEMIPPLIARISVGAVFLGTGWGKLHHLEHVTGFFRDLGIPAPEIMAPFVATNEFVFGTLILFGLATRVAAIPLIITMCVAILTAKKADISAITDLFGMSEYLFIVIFLWLMVFGPGKISLDHLLVKKYGSGSKKK